MQIARTCAWRYLLLHALVFASFVPGFSIKSFLSHTRGTVPPEISDHALGIPDSLRVATVFDIQSGLGPQRPTLPPPSTTAPPFVPIVPGAAPAAAPPANETAVAQPNAVKPAPVAAPLQAAQPTLTGTFGCPSGWQFLDGDVPKCGIVGSCDAPNHAPTIEACAQQCEDHKECSSFEYAVAKGSDWNCDLPNHDCCFLNREKLPTEKQGKGLDMLGALFCAKAPPALKDVTSGFASIPTPESKAPSRNFGIEAVIEMVSSAPEFLHEEWSSMAGFALTVADRLHYATGVPLSRFMFYIADPNTPIMVWSCHSSNFEEAQGVSGARFGTASNTTFQCDKAPGYKLNQTAAGVPPSALGLGGVKGGANSMANSAANLKADLTVKGKASPKKASALVQEIKRSARWEVGVYTATGIFGDLKSGQQVAAELLEMGTAKPEPVRRLLETGLWSYKAESPVKFFGLFPGTATAWPGEPVRPPRDTALELGPNPGGQQRPPPTTVPPEFVKAKENDAAASSYLANVDSVIHEAEKFNTEVRNSAEELARSLARASAAHSAWLNFKPFTLPPELA